MTSMLTLSKTIPPHTGKNILYAGSNIETASKAVILIHGRGSSASSFLSLSKEIDDNSIIYIAPEAEGFTWYPYRFIEKRDRNEPGISSGHTLINSIILSLNQHGIQNQKIFIIGFSQGACLGLDYIARYPKKLGGVFGLSGGLIGDSIHEDDYNGDLNNMPIFLGCSVNDFHIPENRVHETATIFESMNANVIKKLYPDLGHSINSDEIENIKTILLD